MFYVNNNNTSSIDIALVAFPRRTPHLYYATQLPEALGLLKATTKQQGFVTKCFDFDNKARHDLFPNRLLSETMDDYWRETISRQWFDQLSTLANQAQLWYKKWLDDICSTLLNHNPKYLCISIFSEQSLKATIDFLQIWKKHSTIPVIVGGYALLSWSDYTPDKKLIGYELLQKKLIDYFIFGEGEHALNELLKGNLSYPGINNYNSLQIKDLNELPFADYSDFDFRKYAFPDHNLKIQTPMIGITGSRGCVRHCEFCDIENKWQKFTYKSAERLAKETQHYIKTYKIGKFHWSDSIVNASPPLLEKWCDHMIDFYNQTNCSASFSGQFIVREPNQMSETLWQKMYKAGIGRVIFGVESASETLRYKMNKKFSNVALEWCIEQAIKNNIKVEVLLMVGYPAETIEEFYETVEFIKRSSKYLPDITITATSFGWEKDAFESKLNKNPEKYKVYFDNDIGWCSEFTNNYEALQRTLHSWNTLKKYNYTIYQEWFRETNEEIIDIENKLKNSKRNIHRHDFKDC